MLSILLVDDEQAAIDAIQARVDWQSLGIGQVYTAVSGVKARAVLAAQPVDLMVCDIEMPQESGLDLIRWVAGAHPRIVSIFLTCHADFDFARQAVAIGAFDYLLKPVIIDDLQAVLRRAIVRLQTDTLRQEASEQWQRNRSTVLEGFWLEMLSAQGGMGPSAIRRLLDSKKLALDVTQQLIPVLCALRGLPTHLEQWAGPDLDYALDNVLNEVFETEQRGAVVVSESPSRKWVLQPIPVADAAARQTLRQKSQTAVDSVATWLGIDLCAYVGQPCGPGELNAAHGDLLRMDRENVAFARRVFLLGEAAPPQAEALQVDAALWETLFFGGETDALYSRVKQLLQDAVDGGRMTGEVLQLFYHDFLQFLYGCLARRNIPAKTLLQQAPAGLEEGHFPLVEDLLRHVRVLLDTAANVVRQHTDGATVVDIVKSHVRSHLGEELSRDELAAMVYLNPSYLSRMFHQKTGQSLTAFIAAERLATVKKLLEQTGLSVSDVARRTGYVNMPYFCKIFKRETGLTPMEYRRAMGNKSDKNRYPE